MVFVTLTLLSLYVIEPSPGAQVTDVSDAGVFNDGERADDDELDELRALEDELIETPSLAATPSVQSIVGQLGYGSLLRERLEADLDWLELSGDETSFTLDPVTDVAGFDVLKVSDRYDIPLEMHPLVAQYIHFFQGRGRKWFRRWVSRSHRYIPLMQPLLEAKGLPRDTVYLAMIESGFNTQAKSWAKAVGPWQFIAGTAKMFKLREDLWVDERRDPIKATNAAADYLGQLYANLGHWYLAWAGYNTGGGRVRRLIDAHGTTNFWELSTKKGFAKETKHYVPKLIACALVAKHPQAFGFTEEEFSPESPFEFDEFQLTDAVDLEVIASAAGTDIEEIRELNPELKTWCTPPASATSPYRLRLPLGTKGAFAEAFAKFAPSERLHFKVHRVKKGDTLSKIALQYRSAQEAILRLNHLKNVRALRLGHDLVVPVPSASAKQAGGVDPAFEKQVARARRAGHRALRPEEEIPAGTQTTSKKTAATAGSVKIHHVDGKQRVTYGIGQGDSLWAIARRFDVHVDELKRWNPSLTSPRGLKIGTALTIWPGPAAQITASP